MSGYKQLFIYFFSGTGNARKVASWISDIALSEKMQVQCIDIGKTNRTHIQTPPPDALIGFCSPTHGFNFPPVMMNFIFRFPKARRNKVFLINTRAGVKVFKLFIPGLSGVALLLSALTLLLKGYRITGMRSVDLPSNWISLHPGIQQKTISEMFIKWEQIVTSFSKRILSGGKDFRALLSLPVDLIIGPVSFFYYIFGRFLFAKSFYASSVCNKCGLCIKQCPIKAISIIDNRPFWSYRCESCMHCMNSCPLNAIETAHGYIIGLLILLNTLAQSYIYLWFVNHNVQWFSESVRYSFFYRFVFETALTFFALIISYRMVHYLRKIPFIDFFIRYTSLTTYKFWGRYKPEKFNKNL